MNIKPSVIRSELLSYGVSLDDRACGRVSTYIALLTKWNAKVSLTTITKPSDILRFHFGESMFIAPRLPVCDGRLADVGSGAGFPGIALKIVAPGLDVTLIETNRKKAVFLSETIRELNLTGISVFRGRTTELPLVFRNFQYITARAIGQFPELLLWSSTRLEKKGKIILWLGERDSASLAKIQGWTWFAPFKIPHTERRVVLAGSPSDA